MNKWDDAQVLVRAVLKAKLKNSEFLNKLRSLEINLGHGYDHHQSIWNTIQEAASIPGLKEFSFGFDNSLPAMPLVTQSPTSNVKRFIMSSKLLHTDYIIHALKYFQNLEHVSFQWSRHPNVHTWDLWLPGIHVADTSQHGYNLQPLSRALESHKDSLKSLSISSRLFASRISKNFGPISSLAVFEKLEDLFLDDSTLVIGNSFFQPWKEDGDHIQHHSLPPNLKNLTMYTSIRTVIIFNVLVKLARFAPASLNGIKAVFMYADRYNTVTACDEVNTKLYGYHHFEAGDFLMESSPDNAVVVIRTNSFQKFISEIKKPQIKDLTNLDYSLWERVPVSKDVRDLVHGTKVAELFMTLLMELPQDMLVNSGMMADVVY